MNICIFGSSFNPPHIAHVEIVEGLKTMGCDRTIVVPTGNPNHKKIEISNQDRMLLIEQFVKLCDVEVSYHELEQNFEYTVESLNYLNFKKTDKVFFTIGSDSVNTLESWDYFDCLKDMVIFVVVNRPGIKMDSKVLAKINYIELEINTTDISSSQLRANLDRKYIPQSIYQIIEERKLYINTDIQAKQ